MPLVQINSDGSAERKKAPGAAILREAGSCRWDFTVLEQVLEKGVIHRARLQGWWLATENAQQVADQLIAAFVNSPLPLTT